MRFIDPVFGEFWVTYEVFDESADWPGPRPVPRPFMAILANWPIPARQAWGERANALADEGVAFPDDELIAFAEVKARLDAGEFRAEPEGDRAVPRPTASPSLFPEGGR